MGAPRPRGGGGVAEGEWYNHSSWSLRNPVDRHISRRREGLRSFNADQPLNLQQTHGPGNRFPLYPMSEIMEENNAAHGKRKAQQGGSALCNLWATRGLHDECEIKGWRQPDSNTLWRSSCEHAFALFFHFLIMPFNKFTGRICDSRAQARQRAGTNARVETLCLWSFSSSLFQERVLCQN